MLLSQLLAGIVMFNWFDIVVAAILLYTTFRGAKRGLVWQLAWIAALVCCFAFAENFSLQLAPHIKVEAPLNRWIAMFILYMGFSFASFGVARMLRGWIEKAKFVEYDRHLGGIFGFVKGTIIALVLTFFAITLSETARASVLESKSGYAAAVIMDKLEPVMPRELAKVLAPYVNRLDPNATGDLGDDVLADGEKGGTLGDVFDQFGSNSDKNDAAGDASNSGDSIWDKIDDLTGGNRQDQPTADNRDEPGSINDFIRTLPVSMSRDLKQRALDSFKNASPSQRDALMKQLEGTLPSEVGGVLSQWRQLRDRFNQPGNTAQPGTNLQPERNPVVSRSNQLLQTIADLFPGDADAKGRFYQRLQDQLRGIPENVQAATLKDWYVDLTTDYTLSGRDSDPDPGTGVRTLLDDRLVRQLRVARVPVSQLSRTLQERLAKVRQ